MPTYVYACSACDQTFELEQRITEDPIKTCLCGSVGTVKRVIQPVGISFKGSGFYVNDSVAPRSGSEKPVKDAPNDSQGEKPSEDKAPSEKPSESTPATATPTAPSEAPAPTSSTKPNT